MKAVIKPTVNHPWRGLLQMLWLCEPGGYIAVIGLLWGWLSFCSCSQKLSEQEDWISQCLHLLTVALIEQHSHNNEQSFILAVLFFGYKCKIIFHLVFFLLKIQLLHSFWSDCTVNVTRCSCFLLRSYESSSVQDTLLVST
jgi:hypothetical protein